MKILIVSKILIVIDEVMCYQNLQLNDIVTPIKPHILGRLLRESGHDRQKTEELVKGFTEGFNIGYRGKQTRKNRSHNLPLRVGSKTEIWNKIMKEVKMGRCAGPFEEIPYENYMQSPIGLVPKAGGKTRLIFHLSYNFSEEDTSLNANTPKEMRTVKYRDLDHAIATYLKLLKLHPDRSSPLFFSKTDVQSAFRILPIKIGQRCWLVMMAIDPRTGKTKFFVNKCLPFGASIRCAQFQKFSDALQYLAEHRIQVTFCITNYLDDFLVVAWMKEECDRRMRVFLRLCKEVGCPMALEKTEWGTTLIIFLGVLLDGEQRCLAIPEEKKTRAINQLLLVSDKRTVRVKELQGLLGLLNFLCRALVPGRVFMRRIYAKIPGNIYSLQQQKKLKPYHHVNVDKELRNDCAVWLDFLRTSEVDRKILYRPFIDWNETIHVTELRFFSDASANETLGFGATFGTSWTFGVWEPGFIKKHSPSIEYLELYALCIGVMLWGDRMKNRRVVIFCDNMSVVHMVNNSSSSCKNCMYLLRILVTNNMIHNRRIFVKHIRTENNILADSLSRLDFKRFWNNAPEDMEDHPESLPREIWPMSRIWQN